MERHTFAPMKCPYCKKDCKIPQKGINVARFTGAGVDVKVDCCGAIVRVIPTTTFDIHISDAQFDHFGQEKKTKYKRLTMKDYYL